MRVRRPFSMKGDGMSIERPAEIASESAGAGGSLPSDSPRRELTQVAKREARRLGFDAVGVAPATPGLGQDRLAAWLDEGKEGEMAYMREHRDARLDPNHVLDGVRSVVVVALVYRTEEPQPCGPSQARISRYAWGKDYHDVLRQRLETLAERLRDVRPELRCRATVDSAPVMERDYARLAGLGWIGKNTLLLNKDLGSFFFLGALLVDAELEPDLPFESDHCGQCRQCLDACPTQAFDGPYQLDPRRCLSYLTIEHRSGIADELADRFGDWAFGCDVCQDVCPWNKTSPARSSEDGFKPADSLNPLELGELLAMDDASFRQRFRGTPLFRTKRDRVLRSALLVAAGKPFKQLAPVIESRTHDPSPIVADAARWALTRLRATS